MLNSYWCDGVFEFKDFVKTSLKWLVKCLDHPGLRSHGHVIRACLRFIVFWPILSNESEYGLHSYHIWFTPGESGFGPQSIMAARAPNPFVFDPCITHLTSFLTCAIPCSAKWLFSLKFLALAIAVWMRNRKTRHYATVAFGKFWSRLAWLHTAWICSSVTWLHLRPENWFASRHTSHFLFTSSSTPHFLHESNLIVCHAFFFDLNDVKIRNS